MPSANLIVLTRASFLCTMIAFVIEELDEEIAVRCKR